MKCEQCGAEVAKGETFCRVCGARVRSESTPAAVEREDRPAEPAKSEPRTDKRSEKKPENKRKLRPARRSATNKPTKPNDGGEGKSDSRPKGKLLIAAVAAVAVVVLVVIGIVVFGGDKSPVLKSDADRPFVVVTDGVAGIGRNVALYSADGSCLETSANRWQVSESVWNGTTAFLRSDGSLRVGTKDGYAGGLPTHVYTAATSANGAKVAYISGYDGNTGDGGELYLYDVKKGDSTLIDHNVTEINAMSPGGTAVSYIAYDKTSDANHVRISKNAKKGERLLDCEKVYALSDDAKYMCILNAGMIYSVYDGSRVRICSPDEMSFPMLFNSDCTEMLYSCRGDCVIARGTVTTVVANGRSVDGVYSYDAQDDYVSIMPVKKFDKSIIRFDGNKVLWYDAETNNPRTSGIECSCCAISKDGKSMYWVSSSGIHYTKTFGENKANDIVAEPDDAPTAIYGTGKLDHVYYTNARGELWHLRGKKTTMVSADVTDVCMGGDGVLYFVYDGVVLCRANGNSRVSVERREGITEIETVPQGVVVKTTRDGSYYNRNGDGMKLSTTVAG